MEPTTKGSSLYTPLQTGPPEIRLLRIESFTCKQGNPVMQCTLRTVKLMDHNFCALSYVWGDPEDTEEILVNGFPFAATRNLVAFLCQLEKMQKSKSIRLFLWVDAVCINQTDVSERSKQVSLMKMIYQASKLTFAWLGPSTEDSSLAIKIIAAFGDEPWPQAFSKILGKIDQKSPPYNKAWNAIGSLLNRPYWTRVWTFQEVVLSKQVLVLCGRLGCTLDCFIRLDYRIHLCPEHPAPPDMGTLIPRKSMNLWQYIQHFSGTPLGFERLRKIGHLHLSKRYPDTRPITADEKFHLLVEIMHLRATDPRDSIYGLIGVFDLPIYSDYTKSVKSVFTHITRVGLEIGLLQKIIDTSGLGWCDRAEQVHRKAYDLPSWVPEWNGRSRRSSLVVRLPAHECRLLKSPQILATTDEYILKISGIQNESIEPLDSIFRHQEVYKQICDLARSGRPSHTYVTGISSVQAIFRLIALDIDPTTKGRLEVNSQSAWSTFCDCLVALCDYFGRNVEDTFSDLGVKSGSKDLAKSFSTALYSREDNIHLGSSVLDEAYRRLSGPEEDAQMAVLDLTNTRFFRTRKGYIGRGPPSIESGDMICNFVGCQSPVLLRKQGDHWLHVGTCFVLGLMEEEEWMVDAEGQPRPMQVFEIH